ncbi:MAG: peptidoglycan editing factor PgeF [Betaproteobacteria bacterium]|nr:peptidoglycan editing factor PgeF [Betaproteobacteria bacterium]
MKPPLPAWIVPDWPAPPNVKAFITTRAGGVSIGPHASFNLGLRADEDAQTVAHNRAILQQHLPQTPKWLRQVHGTLVVDADVLNPADESPQADASVACNARTVCPVMIADCLPILFTNRAGTRVAGAHAGWRGLSGGVVANTVRALGAAGAPPADLLAYIGPGIGPRAFEVGADVYQAFVSQDAQAKAAFVAHTPGKWLADLFTLARQALARAGVGAVYGGGLCTYSDPARFYSYRRDKITGRMAAFIWRA